MLTIMLCLCSVAGAGQVQTTQQRWLSLQPKPEAVPVAAPPAVAGRALSLWIEEGSVRFVARWRIVAPSPGWLELRLASADVHLESLTAAGVPLPTSADRDGIHLSLRVGGPVEVIGRGRLSGDVSRGIEVDLLPAAGPVMIHGEALLAGDGAVWVAPGQYWSTASSLRLVPIPAASGAPGTLLMGDVGLGLTVGDTELVAESLLRWRVVRGQASRVSLSLPGAGADLELSGPQIARWQRSGDRIEVELVEPESTLIALEASWTRPLPEGAEAELAQPLPVLGGTFRTSEALQIARDSQIEVVPAVRGLEGVPAASLPGWGQDLVQGTPTAAYLGDGAGSVALQLYRSTPAEGPATLIDIAQYTIATTEEGRLLVRAHYAVRNERGAVLRLRPPEGLEVIGVRVSGETAKVSREGALTLIPLDKSVETVQGLLTFPIEVSLLGQREPWAHRFDGVVPLPTVDAEIAVARATVHLPPGYRRGSTGRRGGIVDAFSEGEGITYGFAVGDVRAAQADTLFQAAVDAWMGNDFDGARDLITELETLGANNDNIERLESNLQLVLEGAQGGDVAQARRVKEQARARSQTDVVRQEAIYRSAEERWAVGDYKGAEVAYAEALKIGKKLEQLSADEDVEFESDNIALEGKIAAAKDAQERRSANLSSVTPEARQAAEAAARQAAEAAARQAAEAAARQAAEAAARAAPDELPRAVGAAPDPTETRRRARGHRSTGERGDRVADVPPPSVVEPPGIMVEAPEPALQADPMLRHWLEADEAPDDVSEALPLVDELGLPLELEDEWIEVPIEASGSSSLSFTPGVEVERRWGARSSRRDRPAADPAPTPAPAPAPAVSAAALSVVVPTMGEPVLYQRLLLPAGAEDAVPVRARRTRRHR